MTVGDRIAKSLVAVGGIGTIVAVLLVCVFLVSEVVPLFLPAKVEATNSLNGAIGTTPTATAKVGPPIRLGMDEFGGLGWALFADGRVRCFRLDNGHLLNDLSPEQTKLAGMTTVALSTDGQQAVFGFRDGKLQVGRIGFETRFVEPAVVPADVRDMAIDAQRRSGTADSSRELRLGNTAGKSWSSSWTSRFWPAPRASRRSSWSIMSNPRPGLSFVGSPITGSCKSHRSKRGTICLPAKMFRRFRLPPNC